MSKDLLQKANHDVLMSLVTPGSRVLDLGCGEGKLLSRLKREKNCKVMGVDIQEEMMSACITQGLPVFHGDIEEGLAAFADQSYDFVILSRTLQMVQDASHVLKEIVRVGKKAIITVPNFGYWHTRMQLLFTGRMPVNKDLPYEWYNTPNIHFCTRNDYQRLCKELGIKIEKEIALNKGRVIIPFIPNWFATEVCTLLSL